jgi:AcrR family transcriptional regulator
LYAATVSVVEESVPSGRRERRRLAVRGDLVNAARSLIKANGLDGLRISDITDTVDVARGSFYSHFLSKEDVVDAVVTEGLQSLAEAVATDLGEDRDPAVRASDAARRVIRLTQDDPELAGLLREVSNAEALFSEAMTPFGRLLIERGVEAGRFEVASVDVAIITFTAGAFALIRAILNGEIAADADKAHSEGVLRALGLSTEEAHTISHRSMARPRRRSGSKPTV